MRVVTSLAAGLVLAAATTFSIASPTRLNDVQFIAANRCLGLMSSKTLGTPDAAALGQLVKSQSWGRGGYVYDKADEARDDAQSQAGRAGAELRARLIAERDGPCQTFLAPTSTAATPGSGHSL